MAISVLFEFPGVTQAQYDRVCAKLAKKPKITALSDWPVKGILAHTAGPTSDGWRVFDVWESQAAFDAFGAHLLPIIKAEKFPEVAPQISVLHNFVKA